jgi:hypothetical protein
VKLSPETLLATARLQIELLNNQLEEANRRAGELQAEVDRLKRERRAAEQRPDAPSFFDREPDGRAA